MKHSIGKRLTAGAENVVFTVPAGFKADVSLLFISNHSGNNKTVTALWQHAHDPLHRIYIIDQYPLAVAEFIKFDGSSLVMQSGDTLRITPEAASVMSVIVTFDLYKEAGTFAFDGE